LNSILEKHLQLAPGTLQDLHRVEKPSADHVRLTAHAPSTYSEERAQRAEHTDFGSFTILFNWLGGLQLLLPETEKWVWVKPVPGSAVVNLGDAMVKFTSGILRSNIHRVVPSQGAQAGLKRTSLIYFARPEDDVVLKRLPGGLVEERPKVETEADAIKSVDWITRRSLGDLMGIYTFAGGVERRFTGGHGYAK
jgi:isopenicillin N synthase-like dioxygenase